MPDSNEQQLDPREQTGNTPKRFHTIHVTLIEPGAPSTILKFREPFTIGSDPESDLAIESPSVGAHHAEVVFEDNCWWIRAVGESNGVFLDGKPVDAIPLATGTSVTLGPSGPSLAFTIGPPEEQ
jgi:pSer/pThr/pTyr-binding forkhead associated (FHA) protein